MDGKSLTSIGAIALIAVAVVATAIGMNGKDEQPDARATRGRPVAPQDPLAVELRRCSGIGEAGPRDPGCLRAWAESRRRFLGQRRSATAPGPVAPTTLFPNVPASPEPFRKGETPMDATDAATKAVPSRPVGR